MTNVQLYLAIGIPSLIALLNTAVMLALFGNLSSRIDALRTEVNARIDKLEARIDSRFDRVDADLRHFMELFGRHDKSIEILEKRS